MDLSERRIGKITSIKIGGQAISTAQPEQLTQLVRDRLAAGQRLFIINLADCQRLDSLGLGELLKAHAMVAQREGVLKLADVPLRLRGVMTVARLNEVLEIFDREQDAINSFGE